MCVLFKGTYILVLKFVGAPFYKKQTYTFSFNFSEAATKRCYTWKDLDEIIEKYL